MKKIYLVLMLIFGVVFVVPGNVSASPGPMCVGNDRLLDVYEVYVLKRCPESNLLICDHIEQMFALWGGGWHFYPRARTVYVSVGTEG